MTVPPVIPKGLLQQHYVKPYWCLYSPCMCVLCHISTLYIYSMCLSQFCEIGASALVIRELKGGTEEGWWGCVVMGGWQGVRLRQSYD